MKRLALLLFVSLPVFGFIRSPAAGDRIGVLQNAEEDGGSALRKDLQRELRARGFEAFDAQGTFEDVQRDGASADYYIEIVSNGSASQPVGGIGTAIGAVGVDVSVVVARVAAELRIYDGRTMELVDRFDLYRRNTAVVPTAVGVSTRTVWAFIALPFVNHAQYRAVTRAIARDAAERIARR